MPPADFPPRLRTSRGSMQRYVRGGLAALGIGVAPVGRLLARRLAPWRSPERKARGYVIILPGIESQSLLNHSVVWGLLDAGVDSALEVHDWTTGFTLLFPYHLRGWKRNQEQAAQIARKIVAYQNEYPGRPVHVIGHSGGGAVALLALGALPDDHTVTSAILLAPAVSPGYNLAPALRRTERGIWNFSSRLDAFFLGVATCTLGTLDGRHEFSAGACGFRIPAGLTDSERGLYADKLHCRPYDWRMAGSFHFGGHFGCTNRVFVAEWLAPLLR